MLDNAALEVNSWLNGELVPPNPNEISKVGMEIPRKKIRLLNSEKARKGRKDKKKIRLKKAERLGQDFARLSELGHVKQARSIERQRDRVKPAIRV